MAEIPSFHTQFVDSSANSPKPEHAFAILENRPYNVAGQTVRITRIILDLDKVILFPIKYTYPTSVCSNPEHAIPVMIERPNFIAAQAFWIIRIVVIMNKVLVSLIRSVGFGLRSIPTGLDKPVETSAPCSNPKRTRLVLRNR